MNPRLATQAPAGTGYMHDSATLFITDNRTTQCDQGHNPCEVLIDFNESTVDLWDVTDKGAPGALERRRAIRKRAIRIPAGRREDQRVHLRARRAR